LVEKYKQAIFASAFCGALTREWRKLHPAFHGSVSIRETVYAERDAIRAKAGLRTKGRNRSAFVKVVDLPELPSGWNWLTFDDCAWDLTVGHVGPMKDRYVKDGIAFLRSLNVRASRVDLKNVVYIDEQFHRELAKSQLNPGDLIVVRTGEPGVAAVVPPELRQANCSDLIIARLVQSMNPSYAAFYMNSEFARIVVRDAQVGVAQQHFNVGAMADMPIPLTTLGEQDEIVHRIEAAFAWIDRLASEATSARKLIDHLDQAVLAKAFRGELVPQDPNDEPASLLLERIKAEQAVRSPGDGKGQHKMRRRRLARH
jgi:type I restriction enzyme S subunit